MQHSEYHRIVGIRIQKANYNFIIYFGSEKRTTIIAGIECSYSGPHTPIFVIDQRKTNQHPVLTIRVVMNLCDFANLKAIYCSQQASSRNFVDRY